MSLRLRYLPKSIETNRWMIEQGFVRDPRETAMWTIECPGHLFHGSTRMLEGLIELGIVPPLTQGLVALTTPEELKEVKEVFKWKS